MTTPPPDGSDPAALSDPAAPSYPLSLNKEPDAPLDFDPYRFGAPEHPVPLEYAPPGYVPPPAFAPPPQIAPPLPPHAQAGYPGQPYAPYAGQPYPGQPYAGGPPVPPGYHQYPQPRTGNGLAVASLVLGIVAIVFCWLSVIDVIPVVLAVVFGIVGLGRAKQMPRRDGRSLAIAGIACGVIGAIFATVLTVVIYARIKDCLDYPTNSATYTQCINDKF